MKGKVSLMENSPKDTYINLIVWKGPERAVGGLCGGVIPYEKLDITEQMLKVTNGFRDDNILGIEYQIDDIVGGTKTLYYQQDLRERIIWSLGRLLDASVVNEKQKKALKELMETTVLEAFDHKTKTVDLALQMLDSK